CSFDHHLITHDGYTVTMGEHGRITWTTPAWLDPTRTPRVNGTPKPAPLGTAEPVLTGGEPP
ncbi:MAG: hypothetical protein ABI181_13940, partial [Mycobacteriaceae bacterium]